MGATPIFNCHKKAWLNAFLNVFNKNKKSSAI